MRCCKVMVELLVRPTSATRPIVCGKLAAPIGLPVLKKYSADVALGAFVKKSPTLRNHSILSDANLLGWQCRQDCVVHGKMGVCRWDATEGTHL